MDDQLKTFKQMNTIGDIQQQQQDQQQKLLTQKFNGIQRNFEEHRSKFRRYQKEFKEEIDLLVEQNNKREKYADIFKFEDAKEAYNARSRKQI